MDKELKLFRLTNAAGAYLELLNLGATLVSWYVPDKEGKLENIILNYPELEDYSTNPYYLGSTIGRFANRITKAQFALDGKTYHLDKNDGENCNHGGFNGFHNRIFDYKVQDHQIVFSYESPDGEGGFPGNLRLTVTYTFSDDNELSIEYKVLSDKDTVFNPTNHAYFNLSGKGGTICNHELQVYAKDYLVTDAAWLPTGEIRPICRDRACPVSTTVDFTKLQGFNTFFIGQSKHLATLSYKDRRLDVYSSMPGIQVYTGDYLAEPFEPCAGIALEAQGYPDAVNHNHFPSCRIEAGEEKVYAIQYRILFINS
ncbi:aldose 1-epimerase [Bacteroidia bacterium]|nr:aldose 1-epimerase [Bacteroidia bacterium]GHT52242.1 aldose 1-epimerase [Bacteroidia bacterium]GHT87985.1 aldose 1-epimerase [Bacteroidia bacterium]